MNDYIDMSPILSHSISWTIVGFRIESHHRYCHLAAMGGFNNENYKRLCNVEFEYYEYSRRRRGFNAKRKHTRQAGRTRDVNPYPLVTRFCPIRLDIFIPVALWQ